MRILCLNAGSSSLKCSVQEAGDGTAVHELAAWEEDAPFQAGDARLEHTVQALFERLERENLQIEGIGHRLVFGGPQFVEPELLTDDILRDIEKYAAVAPLHIPVQIAFARAILKIRPDIPQAGAFDTAFHADLPLLAQRFPLPAAALPDGLRRFGYHGLSYEYITTSHAPARAGRVIIAHLGSGASLAALIDGRPHDTSMGLTPLGGIMMGTRPGDLDPGLLLYLLRTGAYTVEGLDTMLEHESGLAGVSGRSGDVRELLNLRDRDGQARLALDLFTYLLSKQIGAFIAALQGLDRLIFTGGIGEHSAEIRAAVVASFAYAGALLDEAANARHDRCISTAASRIAVDVVPTNENAIIAGHAARVFHRQVVHKP